MLQHSVDQSDLLTAQFTPGMIYRQNEELHTLWCWYIPAVGTGGGGGGGDATGFL